MSVTVAQTKMFSNEEMKTCCVKEREVYNEKLNAVIKEKFMDAMPISILFSTIKFNQENHFLKIKGRIGASDDFADKARFPEILIFKAEKMENGSLKNKISLGTASYFRFRKFRNSFSVKSKIEGDEFLFFYSESFALNEYDLKCLIEKK